jgi:DNA-binding beta-propeller fold protein YncE
VLRENDQADAAKNFRFFLESFDAFDEQARGRFTTVRARMMYAMSVAFDPATSSVLTVTVPNVRVHRLVVSRFDQRDMTLSEEFLPSLAGGLRTSGEKRSIDEYYTTGAAVEDGRLYVVSAAFSTVLTIDLATRSVVEAFGVPGADRPVGLAIKGAEFYVASENGTVSVVPRQTAVSDLDRAPQATTH